MDSQNCRKATILVSNIRYQENKLWNLTKYKKKFKLFLATVALAKVALSSLLKLYQVSGNQIILSIKIRKKFKLFLATVVLAKAAFSSLLSPHFPPPAAVIPASSRSIQ